MPRFGRGRVSYYVIGVSMLAAVLYAAARS
jgi:hypothetical protein